MSDQARLRRRIASLERLQAQRITLIEQKKECLDLLIANKALEISNLKAMLTIREVVG